MPSHVNWSLKRTIDPDTSPLTLDETKEHLYEVTTDRDGQIAAFIDEATGELDGPDGALGRALIQQTLRLKMDRFPAGTSPIRLPLPPLVSVTSVQYVDPDGATQTWAAAEYDVLTDREPGEIRPKYNYSYPSIRSIHEAVIVTYVAGYGTKHTDIPGPIRSWLKMRVGDKDALRQGIVTGTIATQIPTINGILTNFIWQFTGPIGRDD